MNEDKEIQEALETFIEQLEAKEEDLLALDEKIQTIITASKQRLEEGITALDKSFSESMISEQGYDERFKTLKETITEETKKALDELVQRLEQ